MRTGQSKAMWQCKLHNLVANFGTNTRDVTWWPNFEPICKKSENAYLKEIQNWNIANLKMTNTRISQSRFSGQREQTCVLILISSWRGWTCSCTPLNPSSGTWSTLLYQNDSIHHQAEIQSGEACVLISPRRTCPQASPTSPSWFWTSTSSTLTRQLASSSSMTRRMQRRLPTVWWSWRAATWRPCGHQQPASLPQRPPDI